MKVAWAAGIGIIGAALATIGAESATGVDSTRWRPQPRAGQIELRSAQPGTPNPELRTAPDTAPPRQTTGLVAIRNGWVYNCMECHTLLGAKWRYDRPLNEHGELKLEHGNNRYCLNCHHPVNRNVFADYDGAEIAPQDVVSLCAKCHGTIFRDWQAGVHGRRSGYWKTTAGAQTSLRCIECHDPHRPKVPAMKPLPPLRYPPRAAGAPVSSLGFPSGSPGPS